MRKGHSTKSETVFRKKGICGKSFYVFYLIGRKKKLDLLFPFYFGMEITFLSCNMRPEMKIFYGPLKYYCGPPICCLVSVDPQ